MRADGRTGAGTPEPVGPEAGRVGTQRLAGNQPTARVRWFWPFHSHSSSLHGFKVQRSVYRVKGQCIGSKVSV